MAYATSILGDYCLAEDVAQESFVDAYRTLPTLREPAAFAAWFRRIVFKHCDRVTRRKRLPATGLDAMLDMASREPSPHDILEQAETRNALRAAIARLSDAEQQVVLLYYMSEQSHAAIAEFLEVTANTVKTRLYSARQRLRAYMADIEKNLDAARPSRDARFAETVQRLIRPADLTGNRKLFWTSGIGSDLWDIFCACITGDLETVKRLIEKEPPIARAYYEYRTPIAFAVRHNQVELAAYLLDHGASLFGTSGELLDVARQRGYTDMARLLETRFASLHGATAKGEPIAMAIRERDLARLRRLLDKDPSLVHAGDARSNQPIHWAVMTRQLDMIDELLHRGADINAQRGDGARPIQLTNGDYGYRGWVHARDAPATPRQVLDHLRARGAYVDICTACYIGDIARVRELLADDASLANRPSDYVSYYACSGTPMRNAAGGGQIDIVKLLLDHGADPNLPEEGIAPRGHGLYAAVYNGHYDIAKLLLEHGAYPNPPVESSADGVGIAIARGDKRMIELLALHGATWEIHMHPGEGLTYADIVATGLRRSINILAIYNDLDTAAATLAANPALADDEEALKAAAASGHEEFVRLLLRHQPDLASRVTVSRPRETAKLLFEHGMDPSRPNWLRITPLHYFAESGDVESAALFLDHGADINARDEELCATPLGWAAYFGHAPMVEFLLRRGAKTNLPDDPPWATPLALAAHRGHEQIVQLLTEYGRSGVLPRRDLAYYDGLASDLMEAASSGEEGAMRRVAGIFGVARSSFNWDRRTSKERQARLRRFVGERLGKPGGDELQKWVATAADARLFVARAHGYESWTQLTEEKETTS
jgi:RNA polymerase sigma factor (sigma-70 family)